MFMVHPDKRDTAISVGAKAFDKVWSRKGFLRADVEPITGDVVEVHEAATPVESDESSDPNPATSEATAPAKRKAPKTRSRSGGKTQAKE